MWVGKDQRTQITEHVCRKTIAASQVSINSELTDIFAVQLGVARFAKHYQGFRTEVWDVVVDTLRTDNQFACLQ